MENSNNEMIGVKYYSWSYLIEIFGYFIAAVYFLWIEDDLTMAVLFLILLKQTIYHGK